MKYTFEKGEKSSVKITVTLTAKEWAAMQDQAYEKTKGKYQLPGFRKGHVPKSVIEQSYGKGAFYEEAINLAFAKYYYDVLEKEPTIEPIDRPDVGIDKLDDKGLTFTATVPVKPASAISSAVRISSPCLPKNTTSSPALTFLSASAKQKSMQILPTIFLFLPPIRTLPPVKDRGTPSPYPAETVAT